MGKLNDTKFPPQVLADWPTDCLFLGTGRRSPTPVPFWRKHSWIDKCHLPPKYSPKGRVNFQRCQMPQIVRGQPTDTIQNKTTYSYVDWMIYNKWLIINHVYASAWIVDHDKYTFPPTLLSTSTSSWKQTHASGRQTCPEYRKPLHPFFPQSYFWSLCIHKGPD